MERVGGPLGVTIIAVVVVLAALLAILHFGFHVFRRRKGKGRAKSGVLADSRVEVLETRAIDAERRLVLIRCDRIEHLIMIGGPADVVVENDVRKVRGPGTPPSKIPGIEPEKRPAAAPRAAALSTTAFEAAMAATPKAPEPHRPAARPSAEVRQAPPPRSLPAVQPASGRATARSSETHSPAPSPRIDETARAQRPQSIDTKSTRRDAAPTRRLPAPPTPVGRTSEPIRPASASAAGDRGARTARTGGRAEASAGLPAAQIPWSDPDSIENEIVRALRFDPQTRGDAAAGRREPPSPKAMMDSHTTLGDLADKLEEALAREVQSANQVRQEPEIDEFGFDSGAPAETERPKPAAAKERQDKPQRGTIAPAPEAEARREPAAPAERREEAPVISLNSRRRETADQLEDEMARLLGELTSDTKGR